MYLEHWGLKEKPFENVPNLRYFYYSSDQEEALMRLVYVIRERKAGIWITGEVGAGKTILSRVLVRVLKKEKIKCETAVLVNPTLPTEELFREIIYQFGRELPRHGTPKVELLHTIEDVLYKNSRNKKHSLVIIDEAHTIIDDKIFNDLRLLLNYQMEDRNTLTLVFLGQPELAEKMENNKPLKERLFLPYKLNPFNLGETRNYILFRLETAGHTSENEIFVKDCYKIILRASGGIPRMINNICDLSLLIGYRQKVQQVDKKIIEMVTEEVKRTEGLREQAD